MLARLRHRAVHRADHEDRAVHLRRAGDHVLDVVGVARAVDVRVVPVGRRVLDVARRDRQDLGRVAPTLRLGRLRDLVVRNELRPALVRGNLRQRGGQRRLAVVDMPDRADVDVWFGSIEFLFCHCRVLPRVVGRGRRPRRATADSSVRPTVVRLENRPSSRRPPPRARSARSQRHVDSPLTDCRWPATSRSSRKRRAKAGADDQDRTGDLVLTKDVLCQLSYIGRFAAPQLYLALAATADRSAR